MNPWRDSVPDDVDSAERELEHVPFTVSASGNTTVRPVTAGRKLRVRHVLATPKPDGTAFPLIKVLLGATEIYRGYSIGKRMRKTGPADGSCIVNLSEAGNVSGTIILEEIPA